MKRRATRAAPMTALQDCAMLKTAVQCSQTKRVYAREGCRGRVCRAQGHYVWRMLTAFWMSVRGCRGEGGRRVGGERATFAFRTPKLYNP